MAKGIDILGTLRGKRGGIVYSRANGDQISRPRVTPRNPKSAKQAVQRMVLATSAKLASVLEPIVNHSFENIPVGAKSVQHFRSNSMAVLRSAAASVFDGRTIIPAKFVIKGAPTFGFPKGLVISRGSLPFGGWEYSMEDGLMHVFPHALQAPITTQSAYEAALAAIGLVPGDQLTFIELDVDLTTVVGSMVVNDETYRNYRRYVRFSRITFKTDPAFDEKPLVNTTAHAFDPLYIEEAEGVFPAVLIDSDNLILQSSARAGFDSGAVIRSQKQENGKFKYSTSAIIGSTEWDESDAWPTYLSYMEGTQIEVGDNLYLQNAVAQPSTGAPE